MVVKPLECKRGIASKLNGQLEFTVVIENASDADQRQYELEKQVLLQRVNCSFKVRNLFQNNRPHSAYF